MDEHAWLAERFEEHLTWLREAGKKDRRRLLRFLDRHAATMPRTALRYATEHLGREQRTRYLNTKKSAEAGQKQEGVQQ
jgi:hypothetical protein